MTTLFNKRVREKELQMNKLAVLCSQGGSYQKKDIKALQTRVCGDYIIQLPISGSNFF